ncbi:MAG: RecX family transcriptional regulator [Anaerolineae bacterium]|nr:MAG: RecX family transcriptional regulator [Anaerolineae bacterium]
MPKITAIESQKRNPQRVNIYLDGEFGFGLSRLLAAWLSVGQELTDEKIAALKEEDARQVALQQAVRFLGYRSRSVHEVREHLQKHAISETLIERTLTRLQESGLLDDRQFAQAWVENRATFRPRSRRMLRSELQRKGVQAELIQQALEQTATEESLAREAARKRLPKLQGLDWPVFREKLGGFLVRRGFSYEVIGPLLRDLWAEMRSKSKMYSMENEE